jgi:3-deoxy-7-phosphoheptulonate synthase
MLIVMQRSATKDQVDNVVTAIESRQYQARPLPGGERVAIGVLYNKGAVDASMFSGMPGVKEVIAVTRPYKLVSRELTPEDTIIKVGDIQIGGNNFVVMAGPCAIESYEQAMKIGEAIIKKGAHIFRGGAYKPRTSPYSFQGMGEEGLKIMAKVREQTGMPIITEVMDFQTFDLVEAYSDIVQIGTRNMQNFSLLRRAGQSKKPIFLKRGMAATIDEWLMAAEYILEGGNTQVILCERGVRTFVNHSRNTLDISAVPVVKKETHLPIMMDPSHAGGHRDQVLPLSLASVAVGAHGIMVEVHHDPDKALSDGAQSLYPEQFEHLCHKVQAIRKVI